MCVILIAKGRQITDREIRLADAANPDGIGVAWFRNDGSVKWRKGLTLDEAVRMSTTLPLPYVMHFRWATAGTKCAGLTHPFPMETRVRLCDRGRAERVLFHNGHVSNWRSYALAAGIDLPEDVSDSAAIAAIGARIPEKMLGEFLREIGSKWVMMARGEIRKVGQFVKMDGVIASNDYFLPKFRQYKPMPAYPHHDPNDYFFGYNRRG